MFVVSRAGDEISLSFDASTLPALPEGWTRTFLLYADGFSKEMNIHSASPEQVAPLPFHGMKRYPYDASESYPLTPERRAYVERYNTRVVTRSLPTLAWGGGRLAHVRPGTRPPGNLNHAPERRVRYDATLSPSRRHSSWRPSSWRSGFRWLSMRVK